MVPLNRKLILLTRCYGLSMPLDKQTQREVMVLVRVIDLDLCRPTL